MLKAVPKGSRSVQPSTVSRRILGDCEPVQQAESEKNQDPSLIVGREDTKDLESDRKAIGKRQISIARQVRVQT